MKTANSILGSTVRRIARKLLTRSIVSLLASALLRAEEPKSAAPIAVAAAAPVAAQASGQAMPLPEGVVVHEVRYDGKITDDEARFVVDLSIESPSRKAAVLTLFAGDLALLPPAKLPAPLRVEREGNVYRLDIAKPGKYAVRLGFIAKINRGEPWSWLSFKGPMATIASVTAEAAGPGVELQLVSGTVLESSSAGDRSRVQGLLAADGLLALRWQTHAAEVARKAVLTAATEATVQVAPTVIKYVTQFRYEILQGQLSNLTIALPASQALTRLVGDQIRDWQVTPEGDHQLLSVEFLRPLEKAYQLTAYSEQTVEAAPAVAAIAPPAPREVERDSGALTLAAEDVQVETESSAGLRQVNAPDGAFAAYRFNARPFALRLKLQRIEPVVNVADRVAVRLEETRLLASHGLTLTVEKAGIYAVELKPDPAFVVADVRGEGVEDWKVSEGKLRVSFSARALGQRSFEVQLEQPLKTFRDQVIVAPLRVVGAAKETAQIGAASAPGISLKIADLAGAREVPVNRLPGRADELLACVADQGDWKLTLAGERLPARVVADIFNLVTLGDGILGGSATIRYGIVAQGVQEFRVRVPAQWKNVEFTGPNIRRKEVEGRESRGESRGPATALDTNSVVWTLGLQDKAWGGYTLVITYDCQFDPKDATLPVSGIHALDVERETGSLALTTSASLELNARSVSDSLRRVDETELAEADRALITRSVLLAYQYAGGDYALTVEVKRHDDVRVLSAVADRTQLTTLLTEAGELLTQASFMVKNNDKQYQRFQLPGGAKFWSCTVNGQPAKPEREGDWLLVPLPRGLNRDQAFAVDLVYAEQRGALPALADHTLQLTAPRTDVPNTYAEWELFAPPTFRLSGFGGNMTVARGAAYGMRDAWGRFVGFYQGMARQAGLVLLLGFAIAAAVATLLGLARLGLFRWLGRGLEVLRRMAARIRMIEVLVVVTLIALLAGLMLPSLASAKKKAQRISAVNNLKQIGLAFRIWAGDNEDRLPMSFEQMTNELGTTKLLTDPETGQPFVFSAAGLPLEKLSAKSILAYSPPSKGSRSVLFADGSVSQMPEAWFQERARRGLATFASELEQAQAKQVAAVSAQQQPGQAAPAVSGAAPPPMAAGIRPMRIEIPRLGEPFVFTKVLNLRDDALAIRARVVNFSTYLLRRTLWQVGALAAGVALCLWQWARGRRNSFVVALGLALALGAVGALLLAWEVLHLGLIVAAPLLLVVLLAGLIARFWPRRGEAPAPAPTPPPIPAPSVVIVLALLFATASAWAGAEKKTAAAAPPEISIVAASYTGSANERVAQLDADLKIVAAEAGQRIVLFGDDVAVEQFTAKPGEVKLLREGRAYVATLTRKGEARLQVKLLVKLGGEVARRQLGFAIPPALTSRLTLAIDQPEADVDFPGAVAFKRLATGPQTRVEAMLGPAGRVELSWTPRVKRAAEIAATVICRSASRVSFTSGTMNTRTVLDYQVTQGELRQPRVRLPAGHRLLRVEGEGIRTWQVQPGAEPEVVVELMKGISPAYRLTIETEAPLGALPATVAVQVPQAVDVKRETGLVALRGDEEVELSVESAGDLQRVDAEEFARASATKESGWFNVFQFLKPEFVLRVRASAVQPQVEAVAVNHVTVGGEQVGIAVAVNYTIKRAGLFALQLALPAGYRVETVGGTNIVQWNERTEGGAGRLEVALKERTLGTYALRLGLVRHFKELPRTLALAGVRPLGVRKLTGYVSVAADAGVAVKTAAFEELTEIPVAQLNESVGGLATPLAGSALAFKFIATDAPTTAPWKLEVATETIGAWVRAEAANTLTLSETLVSGRAVVRFDIANAPVKELRLRVPAALRNVEISGANIRRRDRAGDVWRLELQSKVRGLQVLTVTWDAPRAGKTNRVEALGVGADGVERETGMIAIVARPPLQVSETAASSELQRIDANEWPEWAGRASDATVLAYRYLRPGYTLALEVKRFDDAEVLQALVENLHLSTVVADDGQMMTLMTLDVRNHGRQFVELALPPGATVWSAFVGGQPIRPTRRADKLLLPVERGGLLGAPVPIELTYVATNNFPSGHGAVTLVSPVLDLPLQNARWELYLPQGYVYSDFGGTMQTAGGAAERRSFSLMDYSQQEAAQQEAAVRDVKSGVSSAKQKLATGQVREAVGDYNRARARFGGKGVAEDRDLYELGENLRRVQASNLINAQNDFVQRNAQVLALPQTAAPANQPAAAYDNAAAEAQWTKLQQAQDTAEAQVQPLRVNLPTRGLRLAFTQMLQTEAGRPMTIEFKAANSRAGGFAPWMLPVGGVFVLLWLAVALLLKGVPPRTVARD